MKKRRKFGIGLKIASILTTVAVVSVGLASWIITVPTQSVDATGTIQVDTVSTDKVTLTGKWVTVTEENSSITVGSELDSAPVIYYGAVNTSTTYSWLSNDDAKYENLVAWLKVTATEQGAATVSGLTATFTATNNVTKFEGAITNGSIGGPKFTVWTQTITPAAEEGGEATISYEKVTTDYTYNATKLEIALNGSDKDTETKTYTYYVKVEFKWGTAFGGENAYTYFNNQPYSAGLASTASTALTTLEEALNGVGYKMTISAD